MKRQNEDLGPLLACKVAGVLPAANGWADEDGNVQL